MIGEPLNSGASLTLGAHKTIEATPAPEVMQTEEEARLIQMILAWQAEDANARKQFDGTWEDRIKAYKGKTWQTQKSSNQKQQPEINAIRVVVQTILPILTDANPGFGVLPKDPTDIAFVKMLSEALGNLWDRLGMPIRIVEVLMDQSLLDCGILKVYWNPDLEDGRGDIDIEVKDPRNIWVNKGACDFDRECKRVIERVIKPVGEWKRLFPDKADLIRPDSSSEQKQKEEDAKTMSEVTVVSPVDRDQGSRKSAGEAISDDNGYAEAWEVWFLDETMIEYDLETEEGQPAKKGLKKKYPNGHLVTLLPYQKLILQSVENPNEGPNFNPYVRFVDTVLPRSFYGEGLVESLMDLQKMLNKVAQTIVEYMRLMSNPVWIMDKTSGVKPENITNKVGLVIQKEPGTTVERDFPEGISPSIFEFFRILQSMIDTVAGVHDVTQGRKPAGVTAAEAIDSLQEAAHTRVRLKERNMQVSLAKLARLVISSMLQNYRGARYHRVAGEDAEVPPFVEFGIDEMVDEQGQPTGRLQVMSRRHVYDPEQHRYVVQDVQTAQAVKGLYDVKVQAGTAMPFAKAQRSNLAIRLYEAGAIDQTALLKVLEWEDAQSVIQRMEEKKQREAAMAAQPQPLPAAA